MEMQNGISTASAKMTMLFFKSFTDIKKLNEETNIYGAPTKLRAQQIYSTVTARIKTLK